MEAFSKCSMILLAGVILFSAGLSLAVTVSFPDSNLEAAIRNRLGIPEPTPITDTDMLGLISLFADSSNISDLTGLEYATNLTTLWLHNNNISDISTVFPLVSLEYVFLYANNISDISALSSLTNLKQLYLHINPLNTSTYCAYIPLIESNNPGSTLQYVPNPNPLTVDCSTDLADFAALAEHWLETGCDIPNDWCGWADLDHQDDMNIDDLAEFAWYWLR